MNAESPRLPSSYRPLSVAGGIRAAMHRSPAKIAARCGNVERSYKDLVTRIDNISTWLLDGLHLEPGAHGAILAENSVEYLEIVAGAAQAGIPLATVNPRLSPREAADICDDAQARVLFVDQARAEQARDYGGGMGFSPATVFFRGHLEICAGFDPEQALRRLDEGAMTGVFMVPTHFHDIVDRKKDMVITGGVNVYPSEIEEVLLRHRDIADVAVVGVADERWGERLEAFITLRPGATLDRKKLARYCVGRLARFKIPKTLVSLPELPRNASGKVLKSELRKSSAKDWILSTLWEAALPGLFCRPARRRACRSGNGTVLPVHDRTQGLENPAFLAADAGLRAADAQDVRRAGYRAVNGRGERADPFQNQPIADCRAVLTCLRDSFPDLGGSNGASRSAERQFAATPDEAFHHLVGLAGQKRESDGRVKQRQPITHVQIKRDRMAPRGHSHDLHIQVAVTA